jgi:inositol polyphosphate 5-phosphatase INPP5B/F
MASEADMLVMAFQESDLSPEAFFYLTGTAKEDAWTTAIFAALGERAERYEKVNTSVIVTEASTDSYGHSSYLSNS